MQSPRTASGTYNNNITPPSNAKRQVVGAVDRLATPDDYCVAAAGGFPGEVNNGLRAKGLNTFDCEYGFSCMGYEISGGWGRAMASTAAARAATVGGESIRRKPAGLYFLV